MSFYPVRYVTLFCSLLILVIGVLCVNSQHESVRVDSEKEFSTSDYPVWGDWVQGVRDYINQCASDDEPVACYLLLVNPERDEKIAFDMGYAYLKGDTTNPFPTIYFVPDGVWLAERPCTFSLVCPQGKMTFCEVISKPEFVPREDYDALLERFRRMEKYHVNIAVEASLRWEQYWTPVKKLYDVVGMDRIITIETWENVSFYQKSVSPEPSPTPGAETEIVTVIQKLEELVNNNHKESSPDVQKLSETLYKLKHLYPNEFSNIIKVKAEQLKEVCYGFLESSWNDGNGEQN